MFQRLMAIPQEEYMQLSSVQQARQPITQQFYDLERRYREGEEIREPYKRLVNQSEVLDEMKELKIKMRQGIIESTPKPYQSRAKTLFQSLEPFLKFNERGEIYNVADQLIPQSRLEDLVQHAVRDRRRSHTPTGWPDFRHLLEEHNVPKFMLNRDTLDEMSKVEPTQRVSTPSRKRPAGAMGVKQEPTVVHAKVKKEAIAKQRPKRLIKENPKYGPKFGFLKKY
ncbi:MAG: hypothetical protein AAFO96_28050 [Bacteroidota bacterium]